MAVCQRQYKWARRQLDFILWAVQSPSLQVAGITTVTFKNLSFNVFIDYKFGGTVLTSTLLNMTRQGHSKLSLEGRETGLLFPGSMKVQACPMQDCRLLFAYCAMVVSRITGQITETIKLELLLPLSLISSSLEIFP